MIIVVLKNGRELRVSVDDLALILDQVKSVEVENENKNSTGEDKR
jgi:hypothetical protein